MAKYSIKDLERLSGIKAHTIRIWEKRYGLLEPSRTGSNIRYYSDEDLKKILNISLLNRHGIKISHIAGLQQDQLAEKVMLTTKDIADYHALIDQIIISMVELDEQRFEKIISRAILQIGFEETILKVIYPLLDKIGILWMTGSINPAQEHFISNLVRRKLIVAIDELIIHPHPDPKKFLMFLPEGELHELGLLFFNYLIRKRGHEVVYFGQWVPLNDLVNASTVIQFDYLFTSVISLYSGAELISYIQKLASKFPDKPVFLMGHQAIQSKGPFPENVIRIDSVEQFLKIIE
ncbi:MAG: MerR family transcriptional regulator [Bacteroides sp. SM23_62_1]|nr:MAG: MerR family transcriptional regulator [Bacteroides sp. SM23_62_1]